MDNSSADSKVAQVLAAHAYARPNVEVVEEFRDTQDNAGSGNLDGADQLLNSVHVSRSGASMVQVPPEHEFSELLTHLDEMDYFINLARAIEVVIGDST